MDWHLQPTARTLGSNTNQIWEEVGTRLGKSAVEVKTELKTIVDRRNKIAHEADMDPTLPGARWAIDEVLTNRALAFVASVAEAIAAVT